MDTREAERMLAEKFKYKKLSEENSKVMRRFYADNLPEFFKGNNNNLVIFCTKNGTEVCCGYNRVVIGDYGAFVEFSSDKADYNNFVVKRGQEYRINDPKYKNNVKYNWLTIEDGSDIKIYYQKKRVTYADYIPGFYYVSVHELFPKIT